MDNREKIYEHGGELGNVQDLFEITANHVHYRYSRRMRIRYLSPVRRLGKSRAVVAIARNLAETIWTMLSRGIAFLDEIDSLTERKIESMRARSLHPSRETNVRDTIKLIKNQRMRAMSDKLFS